MRLPCQSNPRRSQLGMTLPEIMVASSIMVIAMGGNVNLGNPEIPAHGHPGNGRLGQSRVIDAFSDQLGKHFLHLTADSFGSTK